MNISKNILAIGAHPDDMEQFCGGTLLLLHELGFTVTILALTSGECGSNSIPSKKIVAIREKEAKKAVKVLGASYRCLNIRDGSVSYDLATTTRIVSIIRELDPFIIFTHPTIDYMADHAHTGQLVFWAVPEATHKHFPDDANESYIATQPYIYHTDPQGLIDPHGQIVKVNTVVDISEVIDTKLGVFATHKSQMNLLTKKGEIDAIEKTRRWAITRGQQVRVGFGEGFHQQLLEQYPRTNILAKLLPEKVYTL